MSKDSRRKRTERRAAERALVKAATQAAGQATTTAFVPPPQSPPVFAGRSQGKAHSIYSSKLPETNKLPDVKQLYKEATQAFPTHVIKKEDVGQDLNAEVTSVKGKIDGVRFTKSMRYGNPPKPVVKPTFWQKLGNWFNGLFGASRATR